MLMQFCRRRLKLVTEKTKLNKNVILKSKWSNCFLWRDRNRDFRKHRRRCFIQWGWLGLSVQKFLKIFQKSFLGVMQTNFKITNFITPVEKEVALDLVVRYRDWQVYTKLKFNIIYSFLIMMGHIF